MYDVNCFTDSESVKSTSMKLELLSLKTSKDLMKLKRGISVSGSGDLLAKACLKKEFFLVNPLETQKFFSSTELIRAVADNGKVFEIPLLSLLRSSFVARARLVRELQFFLRNCLKYNAEFVFSSRAENEFDLKTERELIAILQELGLTRAQAAFALNERAKRVFEELN
ncbi:MAG: RNase P subunit p30 family protein [Candidatus Micrarchaeota archaeon]